MRAGARPVPRRADDLLVPWLVVAAAAAAYVALAWPGWRDVATPSWDLGIFTQLARAYSEGGPPVVDIKGHGFNLLGDHFHPILVALGPLYRLHPSGWTLLVTQAVLLALSAHPVTSVARQLLGRAPGTVLGVGYAFSWGLQGAVLAQFHEIAFGVPLLAFSLAAYLRGRPLASALWAAPLVLVKEDLGLTVAVLGLLLLRRARPGRGTWRERLGGALRTRAGRIGACLTLWGIVWLFLAVVVILPALNPGGAYDYVDRIGDEHTDWFATAVTVLWPPVKIVTLALLALTAGVVGVRSPLVWLALPTLAWRFVGNVPYYWGWEWHYSAILMPVVAAALVDAVRRRRGDDRHHDEAPHDHRHHDDPPHVERTRDDRPTADRPRDDRTWTWVAVGASLSATLALTPSLPLVTTFRDGLPEPSTRNEAAHDAVAAAGAVTPREGDEPIVVADIFLLAQLVPT
ncbi:MAG: DUF2079 domain-containing protein, partial [Actinomycetaceae bacterium]